MHYVKLDSEYDELDKYKYYEDIFYCKKDTDIAHNPYGPAIIYKDGTKYYCIENKYHRLDGPSIIYSSGREAYYINDEYLTKEQFDIHPERLKYLGKEYLLCIM